MNRHDKGISTTGILLIVLVLIGIGGAVYMSDIWSQKVSSAYKSFSEWTPENIAKHPILYLEFCEEQVNGAVGKLKASEIAFNQRKAELTNMKQENEKKVELGTKALNELKASYTKAESDNSWPIDWQSEKRDKDFVKRQIVTFHNEIEHKNKVLTSLDKGLSQIDTQLVKVKDQRNQCIQQVAEIKANREILKVKKITDELTKQLVDMKSVLSTTITSITDASTTLSLDDLKANEKPVFDDTKFDEIMKQ